MGSLADSHFFVRWQNDLERRRLLIFWRDQAHLCGHRALLLAYILCGVFVTSECVGNEETPFLIERHGSFAGM